MGLINWSSLFKQKEKLTGKRFGDACEDEASKFLKKNGYKIIERNFRCRSGEIDIIAKEGKTVVFVEVKARNSATKGDPASAVTARKQKSITRAALHYLKTKSIYDQKVRFDVIAINESDPDSRIRLIKNAFEIQE